MALPKTGRPPEELLHELEHRKQHDLDWANGRVFAYVYDAGDTAMQLVKDSFTAFITENGLDPTTFPSAMALEKEVLGMAIDLMKGGPDAQGSFTSGGTESLLLSIKTARDYMREHRPSITQPELLLPETAHASFFKGCHYFDIKPVTVPVDPVTFQADPVAMAAAITPNTIMMVASAPGYAHGVIDPIAELGQIALKHDLLFHVDCCVGGMYLPFARQLGYDIADFDLSVPGVSQLSLDFHKWGYAAKGASAIIYKHGAQMRRHQIFAWSGWTGYSVVNPTLLSTKSAGPVAACWAIMNHLGEAGYLALVEGTQVASAKIRAAIATMPELYLLGEPKTNLLAFASDTLDVFALSETMKGKGWYIQPQFGFGPSPANIHLSVGNGNVPRIDEFLHDLRESVEQLRLQARGPALAQLPPAFNELIQGNGNPELFDQMAGLLGSDGSALPGRMDEINNLLNAMPHPVRDQLLTEFVNRLYRAQ